MAKQPARSPSLFSAAGLDRDAPRPLADKNLFELKNAQRVLFEGNILENSWGGFSQRGFAID